MTPAWYTTDDVLLLLQVAADSVSDRRLRLFMLACAERVTPSPQLQSFPEAVRLLRRKMAGRVPREQAKGVARLIQLELRVSSHPSVREWCQAAYLLACSQVDPHSAWLLMVNLIQATSDPTPPPIALRESRPHADLLREFIRPPYADLFADEWRTETVRLLADAIHADQAFDRMPILADALEEAGCDNVELLNHCRGPGPHVPGCWALDLVRGCY